MRATIPGKINQTCMSLYDEPAETAVPRLMRELETPQRVAGKLDVTTTAVRQWILGRGWVYNGEKWVAPEAEAEHAPEAV